MIRSTNRGSVPVRCGACGQITFGLPVRLGGWSLRKHKDPRGNTCLGTWRRTGHQPAGDVIAILHNQTGPRVLP
jgi:hypothetical protein